MPASSAFPILSLIHISEPTSTGLRRLERVDLWEVSIVTFPMLPQARISAVKAACCGPAFA